MFWGVGTFRAGRLAVVVKVNDEVISQHQFQEVWDP